MSHSKQDLMLLANTVLENESGSSDRYELAEFIMSLPFNTPSWLQNDQGNLDIDSLYDRLSSNVRPATTRRSRRQTKINTAPVSNCIQAHIAAEYIFGIAFGIRVNEDMVASTVAEINEPKLANLIDVVLMNLRIYSGHVDFLRAMRQVYTDRGQWFGNQPNAIRKIIHRYRKQLSQYWNGEHAGRSH